MAERTGKLASVTKSNIVMDAAVARILSADAVTGSSVSNNSVTEPVGLGLNILIHRHEEIGLFGDCGADGLCTEIGIPVRNGL